MIALAEPPPGAASGLDVFRRDRRQLYLRLMQKQLQTVAQRNGDCASQPGTSSTRRLENHDVLVEALAAELQPRTAADVSDGHRQLSEEAQGPQLVQVPGLARIGDVQAIPGLGAERDVILRQVAQIGSSAESVGKNGGW